MNASNPGLAQGLVVLALIGLCATLSSVGNGPLDTSWKAVSASGAVENRAEPTGEGHWLSVRRGDLLAPRSRVRTFADGSVTLSSPGGVLMIDAETQLTLPARSFQGRLEATQHAGTVVYETAGEPEGSLRVVTPGVRLASGQGVFGVTVDGDWTLVSVEHGIVEVSAAGEVSMDLYPGEAIRVHNRDGHAEMLRRDQHPSADDGTPKARRIAWKRHRRMREAVARFDRELRDAGGTDAENLLTREASEHP